MQESKKSDVSQHFYLLTCNMKLATVWILRTATGWRREFLPDEIRYCVMRRWRHNGHDSVSNHLPHDCLPNRLFRRRSKKTSKLRVTVLCVGNSPGTGEFPAQMASNAENVSIWWRHHGNEYYAVIETRAKWHFHWIWIVVKVKEMGPKVVAFSRL